MPIYSTKLDENVVKLAKDETHVLALVRDDHCDGPREGDNLGTMLCMHGRYNLGDKHEFSSSDFSGWDEIEKMLWDEYDAAVVLRLDLYDHSGITMCVGPYLGPDAYWDSGQVGFIYVTKADIRKKWGIKRVTKKYIENAERILRGEVNVYDRYLRGEVYGFIIETADEEEVDSCWGFYGDDIDENGMKDHIAEEFHHLLDQLEHVHTL